MNDLIKENIYEMVKNNNGVIVGSIIIESLGKKYNVLNREVGTLLSELVDENRIGYKMIDNRMVLILL